MALDKLAVQGVLETCLYVVDLETTRQFYTDVMGLEFVSEQPGRHVFFRCGASMVLFFLAEASNQAGQELPPHGSNGSGHVAFAVKQEDLPQWREQLAAAKVAIESEIQWPQGGESIYFRDPSENSVELATPNIWRN